MARLFIGMLVGVALAAGGLFAWSRKDACFDRCGADTRCEAGRCVASAKLVATAPAPPKVERRRRRAAPSGNSSGNETTPAAAEVQPKPGDDKPLAQGDALGRPEHIDLSQPGPDGRSLEQGDFDAVVHPAEPAINRCIVTALGDAPLETGHIEVAFRVERGGDVGKVRVTAPTILQKNGLTRCVRTIVTGLHFPKSGGANVVTYPFEIR